MFKLTELNTDTQLLMLTIIAEKAVSYLTKNTYISKNIAEKERKHYPVVPVANDIQFANVSVEKCREWIDTKNKELLDDFCRLIDGGDQYVDLPCIHNDSVGKDKNVWECIMYCVAYCYRVAWEYFDDTGVPEFLENIDAEIYEIIIDAYSKVSPSCTREIDELERFFVTEYPAGVGRISRTDLKRFL